MLIHEIFRPYPNITLPLKPAGSLVEMTWLISTEAAEP